METFKKLYESSNGNMYSWDDAMNAVCLWITDSFDCELDDVIIDRVAAALEGLETEMYSLLNKEKEVE